jgi:hypothetical protein
LSNAYLCDVSLEDCCCPNWLWSGA